MTIACLAVSSKYCRQLAVKHTFSLNQMWTSRHSSLA